MRVPPPPAPARAGIALSLPQQGKGGGAWSAGLYPAIALPCGLRARQGGKVGDRAVAVLVDDQCAAERQVGRIGRDAHLHSRGAFQILGDHGERRAVIDEETAAPAADIRAVHLPTSEERRLGKECVRTCNSRVAPY